ncbi:MAG: hypothetical protein IIA08_09845 [Proteobacteria bacterium]|nr:hypothetical protein [Pseudomonadota bacterium]
MAAHHTKDKGDLGVLKAQVDLFEQGFAIFTPQTEHCPFDLVAYKDGEFRRVQVKYRAADRYGACQVRFANCWADRNGTHTRRIDKDEVDLYCIYCPDTDECYYIEPAKFGSNVSLRVRAAKNGQQKGVHLAAGYRRAP